MATIQQDSYNILPALHSGLAVPKESTPVLKNKNITFGSAPLLLDKNSFITPKNTTKPKWTHRGRSHSPAPKRAKVTGG